MQHQTIEFKIEELVRMAASGAVALPDFQRDFVWEPNQVTELLDSVSHGWPIGSLLLLEGPQPFGLKPLHSGPKVSKETTKYYLLDGQQRVTALFHALSDASEYVYYVDLADLEGDEDGLIFRWAKRDRGIPQTRRETSISVADLLDRRGADQRILGMRGIDGVRSRNAVRERLGYLGGASYRIPATVMGREIELEAMTRIFETINRTGVPLNAFDLMVAVLYPVGFNLKDKWDWACDLSPILRHFDVDGLEVLKLLALWFSRTEENLKLPTRRRVQGVRQRDVLRVPPRYIRESWDGAVTAYVSALEVAVDQAGIRDKDGIPSDAMLLTLACFLANGVPIQDARRWWWRAIADQRYLQGANTQILTDLTQTSPGTASDSYRSSDQIADALQEPVRRNRILRLGFRGLIVTRGASDPLSNERLRGSVTDVALSDLLESSFKFGPDRPTAELVVFNTTSIDEVRRRLRRKDTSWLSREALNSQGVTLQGTTDPNWRTARATTLASWMEREL